MADVAEEKNEGPTDTAAPELSRRLTQWVAQGQALIRELLGEYARLEVRAGGAEQQCERLGREVEQLRDENLALRRRLADISEVVDALIKETQWLTQMLRKVQEPPKRSPFTR